MKILVTEPISEEGVGVLSKSAQVDVKLGLKHGELLKKIGQYDALIVRSETKVTSEVIEAGHKLQVVARAGIGVDNIDVEAATHKGIVVVNAPVSNTVSAAEHTVAMMLSLARHIPQAHTCLKGGTWTRSCFMGVELRNKTLGIVGLGNVGSEVARRVQGFKMRVVGYDPFISPEYVRNIGVEMVSLEELLKDSDFITLHLPLKSSTKGLIGAKELMMVKPCVRIVNCARGGLIDEEELLKALDDGRVAGAAMDVFIHEPCTDSVLLQSDKVIVTPHLGASTIEAQANVAVDIAEQVVAVLEGNPARYAVNAPLVPPEVFAMQGPFIKATLVLGRLVSQLVDGQMSSIDIGYEGDVGNQDTSALKAATLGGILEGTTEERVNLVNAGVIAQRRGLRVIEYRTPTCENYSSLVSVGVTASEGNTTVAGTVMRGEIHIVRINEYWLDLVHTPGYFLFIDHRDRPGLIGAVGMITGKGDVNISFMQLSRLEPRGRALMVLALDEPLKEEQRQEILALSDVHAVRMVQL
ncbi:MAG: phosphoglycerate dehydrogenase [Chloroflexota bacterium]|nr:phosphoglycerate dehydrogenase [Chloroflexota bacterium]